MTKATMEATEAKEQKQVLISQATPKELINFANIVMGLMNVPDNSTPDQTLAIIRDAGWDKNFVLLLDDIDESTIRKTRQNVRDGRISRARGDVADTAKRSSNLHKAPMCRIVLNATEEPGGGEPLQVNHNGVLLRIPRGVNCDIPYPYLAILQEAIKTVYQQVRDPITNKPKLLSKNVPAHPFQIVTMPPQEEIDAWIKRTAGIELGNPGRGRQAKGKKAA